MSQSSAAAAAASASPREQAQLMALTRQVLQLRDQLAASEAAMMRGDQLAVLQAENAELLALRRQLKQLDDRVTAIEAGDDKETRFQAEFTARCMMIWVRDMSIGNWVGEKRTLI